MFTRILRYLLRAGEVGLAVAVAGALFGPQVAVSARTLLSAPVAKETDKDTPSAVQPALPLTTSTPVASKTTSLPIRNTALSSLAAVAAKATELPVPLKTTAPTQIVVTPHPTPKPTHTETPSHEPTVSASPSSPAGPTTTPSAPSSPEPTHTASSSPTPKPPVVTGVLRATKIAAVLAYARAQIGERYVFGGAGPNAWDCSGLTMKAFAAVGINIGGHGVNVQYNTARAKGYLVPFANRQSGDLVFYGTPGNFSHVAIYSGGGRIIEAANPARPVIERPYWGTPYSQVARFIR